MKWNSRRLNRNWSITYAEPRSWTERYLHTTCCDQDWLDTEDVWIGRLERKAHDTGFFV